MKTHLLTALLAAMMPAGLWAGLLKTYKIPDGAPKNSEFSVMARLPGNAWRTVETYAWKVDHVSNGRHNNETSSVASFDFSGQVEVAVVHNSRKNCRWRVRPLGYNMPCRQHGDTLFINIDQPRFLSVEADGDIYHNLQLFANGITPKVKKGRNVVWFGPGYHELKDSLAVLSGQTVYIDGGAYIKGFLSVYKQQHVRIIGTGIVNPERQHEGIMVRYSADVDINGPLTTQIPVGQSNRVRVENAKVISWYGWGDGMNVFASENVSYRHVFCRTSDDCSTIYCTRKGYHGSSRHISVDNAVYWADVAHPIMIGLHGDIDKKEEVCDVTYNNVDILQQNEPQIDYQGCIAINNGDNILVHDLTFSNIRIEDITLGSLLNMRVCYNKKYCHAPGRGICNVRLKNISYKGNRAGMSMIVGYNEERGVSGICFDNLQINGRHIADNMADKPKWYKTSDMANTFLGEHVTDVT